MSDFKLKVFLSVATHLSFTKAAEELFISQPAVSKNIQELEAFYKTSLFYRQGNKIVLTKAGEVLYNHASQISRIYNDIDFDINILKEKISGRLLIGASTTLGQYVIPPLLAKFHERFPDVQLTLSNANTQKIEKALCEKKITLGIVEGKSKNAELKYIPFLEDEIVAVASTSQMLAKKDEISIEELTHTPLVLRESGSGSLEFILYELGKHHIKLKDLNLVMHLGSTESIKSFLENANTLGFMSIAAVSKQIAKGDFKIIDIKGLQINRVFRFVHLQGATDKLSDIFMNFCINEYRKTSK